MDYSLLHKALVKRAVKSLKDAQEKNGKLLWTKHEEITQKKCRGWIYSWYVYDGGGYSSNDPKCFVVPIHESLEKEAKSHVEKESSINEIIIQISVYINKILTVYDQCLSYAHVALPPFLHPVIKEFMIGLDTSTEIKFQLTENELKGKEELYALNLLEMTGD